MNLQVVDFMEVVRSYQLFFTNVTCKKLTSLAIIAYVSSEYIEPHHKINIEGYWLWQSSTAEFVMIRFEIPLLRRVSLKNVSLSCIFSSFAQPFFCL